MSDTFEQQHRLDEYGYPLPPDSRRALRKNSIRASKRVLLTCIYLCLSVIGFFLWLGRLGKRYPRMRPESVNPRHILVIRLDLIGDLVLSTVVIRTLKRAYPEAAIDVLATPGSAKILEHDPDIAQLITYDPNIWRRPQALLRINNWRALRLLLQRLHARHYDIAVSVFGPWAAILAVLSGAKRRVGFGKEGYPGFMTDNVPGKHWTRGERKHEVDYCLELAKAAGATVSADDRIPHLYVQSQARQEVAQLLEAEGVSSAQPLIACHVSSNNGQSKRWPLPYWATLIARLVRDLNAVVVLTGAPGDIPLIESILLRMQDRHGVLNLAGKTSLPQLAALLERADLMITGDSGPMHIAAAVGTPLIAIHGPTDPAHSGPVSPRATILRSDIWCSPCYAAKDTADCRFFTTQCMKKISPAQVFQVVQEQLQTFARDRVEE